MKSRKRTPTTPTEPEAAPPVEAADVPQTAEVRDNEPLSLTVPDFDVATDGALAERVDDGLPVTLARPRKPEPASKSYAPAFIASALWIAGVGGWAAYEIASGVTPDPLRLAFLAVLAVAPIGVFFLLAGVMRQSALLAGETRRTREMTDALVAPSMLATRETGDLVTALRGEIDQAILFTERARRDLSSLREALADETALLNDAAGVARAAAAQTAAQMSQERDSLKALAGSLEKQAAEVVATVERQSRMVADASDLAQTQLREAEAALAARAGDMAAAAGEAQEAARSAADDLARQTLRLENAGAGVSEQIQAVEEGLGQQRAALVTAAYALRTDQEDFSAQVESQRAQLTGQLSATQSASGALAEASARAGETIRELVEAATDQFKALSDVSKKEASGFDNATKTALDRFEALAAQARDALVSETRSAMEAMEAVAQRSREQTALAATEAQQRADRLGEAVFTAADRADKAADLHVANARKLVSDAGELVDHAGERAVERLELTLERLNASFARIEEAIDGMDQRAARLPVEAQSRIEAVRTAVESGLTALTEAHQKAAAETERLDESFQDRVRRNYEMLTETVRLIGVVSGEPAARPKREKATEVPPSPEPQTPVAASRSGNDFGLRGRLKLGGGEPKPDETPMELDAVVLTPKEAEALGDTVVQAVRRLGIDPNALLPRARVDDAAQAILNEEPDVARQIVRRVAPAAVRSVSRRVLTDADLRRDAETWSGHVARDLAGLVEARDPHGVHARLLSDAGRTWLLINAAVGDLT